ncbi:iron-hydroxamate ABC transporter substrate-binding protein (plasmid) [Priestia aryabhattai]|uniref:iron-hydroxamate ABC transporter substrate-binding protein n=1 Tax=Priestia aryabhattai TaxID=412384 RepID=UPI001C0D41EA|nr:iron-hydroxamate ABC transporter substrate-binding protein [Priestia aryabhattai]MBU3574198.1 iron-hydroxamate ABC transporter substrate-binding protein [Priestia aryabhattai]WDL89836.1 iron-hydroxamate ABC transporter substrate-binding protein [Priestia aryabhattai]
MKKKIFLVGMATVFSIGLGACGNAETTSTKATKQENKVSTSTKQDKQTITYLNNKYTVPKNVTKIATASLESMEDAAVLGVKPVGAVTVGGKIPEYLAKDLDGAESIGEKIQPNYETLLKLKPDVILWTSKSPANVTQKLEKMAPTFPYSHISTNWEDNLRLMGELTGKDEKAEKIITKYNEDAAKAKEKISEKLKGKKVIVARVRGGSLYLYPQDVYLNPVIYNDLGISVPEEIKPVKAQELISLEKLAEINPDYIFLQFSESENAQKPKALEELQNNAIWKSITAAKDNKVFVNSVDPLAQGGTAWSKTAFLKVAAEDLTK